MSKQYFGNKVFNGEVFKQYIETLPRLARNELLRSGAIYSDPSLVTSLVDGVGGNYITRPIFGLIGGDALNYDGQTDITATETGSASQSLIVVGRAKAWSELDFSYDIAGKTDFMGNVASQVAEYWDEVDQEILLSVLKGIFSMTGTENLEFVEKHTYKSDKPIDAVTLNVASQKAMGDNKNDIRLIVCHSRVATTLENLNLLDFLKYTDSAGIERSLPLATYNGKLVLIDDAMPFDPDTGEYTSYILGRETLNITDVGAKVPYEVSRDPAVKGGQDMLFTRQRKVFAPKGISFTMSNVATLSPTNAELENGANWSLARGQNNNDVINHRAIGIGRIITVEDTPAIP